MPIISFIVLFNSFLQVRTHRRLGILPYDIDHPHLADNWGAPLIEYVLAPYEGSNQKKPFDEDIMIERRYKKYFDRAAQTRYIGVTLSNIVTLYIIVVFGIYHTTFFIPESWRFYDGDHDRYTFALVSSAIIFAVIGNLYDKLTKSLNNRNWQIDVLLEELKKEKASKDEANLEK